MQGRGTVSGVARIAMLRVTHILLRDRVVPRSSTYVQTCWAHPRESILSLGENKLSLALACSLYPLEPAHPRGWNAASWTAAAVSLPLPSPSLVRRPRHPSPSPSLSGAGSMIAAGIGRQELQTTRVPLPAGRSSLCAPVIPSLRMRTASGITWTQEKDHGTVKFPDFRMCDQDVRPFAFVPGSVGHRKERYARGFLLSKTRISLHHCLGRARTNRVVCCLSRPDVLTIFLCSIVYFFSSLPSKIDAQTVSPNSRLPFIAPRAATCLRE